MQRGPRPNPPWTHSPQQNDHYVYVPNVDRIYWRNGRYGPRPLSIPRNSPALVSASYNGPLPPPTQLPQHEFPTTNSPPTATRLRMHPGSPPNIVGAMGKMSLTGQPHQNITPRPDIEVVFHQGGTQSQIARKQPPPINARGVTVDKSELTSTLFKAYKIRDNPKKFFKVGKVFLVLWSEPAGGASRVSKWAAGTVINQLGERVFSKVRRFVVIREGGNYCNALPISTYSNRGVAKPGVNKSEHVIIYTSQNAPLATQQELPAYGEAGMKELSIKVDPDGPDEFLEPMSRLDLGGVTKVEHNIKVKPVGNVNSRYIEALRSQYANVQNHQAGVGASSNPVQYKVQPCVPVLQASSGGADDEEDEDEDEDGDDEDENEDDDGTDDDEADNTNKQ
jgi:hypothetical protein